MVVIRPIGNGAQRGARCENIGLREHRHQSDETAVTPAIKADLPRINAVGRTQVFGCIHDVVEVLAAHVLINGDSPVAAVTRRTAVVHVDYYVAVLYQEVMEQVFVIVRGPLPVYVLQVPRAVHENYPGAAPPGG